VRFQQRKDSAPKQASLDRPPSAETLTPGEAARALKVSESWLAKARMRGEGPPFMHVGRSIRYFPLGPWMEAQRQSSMKKC
jgi:hypothetical protein